MTFAQPPHNRADPLQVNPLTQHLSATFAYDELDDETRTLVMGHATAIRDHTRRMVKDMVIIGTHLQEVKARLRHGQWGKWLLAEFAWSQDTAERLMLVAQWANENPHVAELADRFTATALYVLAAPSTPDEVREQLLAQAVVTTSGPITRSTVQSAITAAAHGRDQTPHSVAPAAAEPDLLPSLPLSAARDVAQTATTFPATWAAPALGTAAPVASPQLGKAPGVPSQHDHIYAQVHADTAGASVPLPLDPLSPSLHTWLQEHGIHLYRGDNRVVLPCLPANSVDSAVCDPPAGISFLNADWDTPSAYEQVDNQAGDHGISGNDYSSRPQVDNPMCRTCQRPQRGGHNEPSCICIEPDFEVPHQYLATRQQFIDALTETFRAAWRVLKPGGHVACWAFPVTSHWTMLALENAGYELRNVVTHHFGSGFPKSVNISKTFDRCAGVEREVVAVRRTRSGGREAYNQANADHGYRPDGYQHGENILDETAPATPQAEAWNGWGTALKPSTEFWIIARKPLASVRSDELHQLTGWDYWCSRHTRKKPADIAQFQSLGYEPMIAVPPALDDDDPEAELADERELERPPQPHFILERRRSLHAGCCSLLVLHHAQGTTILEQKPYRPWATTTVAANVLKYGTGALNIDAARVRYQSLADAERARQNGLGPVERARTSQPIYQGGKQTARFEETFSARGRWPSDMVLTHTPGCIFRVVEPSANHRETGEAASVMSNDDPEAAALPNRSAVWHCVPDCPAALLDAQSGISRSAGGRIGNKHGGRIVPSGSWQSGNPGYGDIGGASRYYQAFSPEQPAGAFVYVPKPAPSEKHAGLEEVVDSRGRRGNRHPTVKSRALMRYLITLVTPTGGTVLDCFLGSGTTGVACIPEAPGDTSFSFIGIERADEYGDLAPARCREAIERYQQLIAGANQPSEAAPVDAAR